MSPKIILFVAFANVLCSLRYASGGPTVVPANPFSAEKDAEIVYKAVKGCGTEEDDVNKVMCKRTYKERMEIAVAFEANHGNLKKRLEDETSRDLKKIYRRLLESPQEIMAIDLHDTIDNKRKDYGAVTEILCGTDGPTKSLIGTYYKQNYNIDVMEHVKNYKGGDALYQSVLFDYCWRTYCTTASLTAPQVQAAAQALSLVDAKTDCETFKGTLQTYFKTYCLPDLQLIFMSYRSIKNKGINEAIRDAMKGDEAEAWVALTLSTETRYQYYAILLHEAMDGCGTDEDRIMRIILQTCETYLGDINEAYKLMYQETIYDRIGGLDGDFASEIDFKDCVKKLLGQ